MADHEQFLRAEHFVAAVQSRLARDAASVPPRLWIFMQRPHVHRLWALRQQALVGSCDRARGSKQYAGVASGGPAPCLDLWGGCCVSGVSSDGKMKLWQKLGEMPADEAEQQYVRIVNDLLPEWSDPQPPDAALLRTWTPDDDSDECSACGEAFTFLNRRHHCRRCLSLVCAVCSPYSLPLRVFSQQTTRRQRLCGACYADVSGSIRSRASSLADSESSHNHSSHSILSRKSFSRHSSGDLSSSTSMSTSMSSLTPPPLTSLSPSTTIHMGPLEFFHGTGGFRKAWRAYFFVLLVRKGSLGMFAADPSSADGPKRPAAVFKLSGYALRVRAQKRRPHQFRLAHATKKPLLFAAGGMDDLRAWLAALLRAIECADELERRVDGADGAAAEAVEGAEARKPQGAAAVDAEGDEFMHGVDAEQDEQVQ